MTDFIKKKYPEYDPNHPRYKLGTVVEILNHGRGVVINNCLLGAECVIVKSTFGCKAGYVTEVPYRNITGCVQPTPTERLIWKVGDVFRHDDCLWCLYESDGRGGGYAVLLEGNGNQWCRGGERYYILNPYRHYLVNDG